MLWHAAFDIAMIVPPIAPCAVQRHNEAHIALDHPPGQQALPAELLRYWIVEPIKFPGRRSLAGQIDQFGRLRLHAERQLVSGDARFKLARLRMRGGVLLVEPAQQVQFAALAVRRHPGQRSEIHNGRVAGPEYRALVRSRKKPVPPHRRAANRRSTLVAKNDKAGQTLVLAAESVRDPRAD